MYPHHWKLWKEQTKNEPRVAVSFGLHPHLIDETYPDKLYSLEKLLAYPQCVGIGEVGIDTTSACKCPTECTNPAKCHQDKLEIQTSFLREVAPLAKKLKIPLILHCRDHGTSESMNTVFDLLTDLNLQDVPLHLHCFTGSLTDAQKWHSSFPLAHFGISTKILKDPTLAEVVSKLDINRLLVESDAPYLAPEPHIRVNTPWCILLIMQKISEIRNMPVSILSTIINENARNLYRLQI